jgi:hypothetical protein
MASGFTAHNLGVDGYGPQQYLILFRRYAPALHPRVALFCVFEGNDIADMSWWADWRATGGTSAGQGYIIRVTSGGFFARYGMFVDGTYGLLAAIRRAMRPPESKLVEIELAGKRFPVTFFFKSERRQPELLLRRREWRDLESVLRDFKREAAQLDIDPLVIFIPTMEHVYGALTTNNSDRNWLENKAVELASAEHTEQALTMLAASVDLRVMSLTPVFKAQAAAGVQPYYPLDSHWNSAGREIAARFVAAELGKATVGRQHPH